MKFIACKKALTAAIDKILGVANNKSTLESTKHLLFEAGPTGYSSNTLLIHATDLDIFATVELKCEIVEKGSLCLLASRVSSLVRNVESDTVEIKTDSENWASMKSGRSKARIAGMHADVFPQRLFPKFSEGARIETTMLTHMIDKNLFCVATNESRANLTGANLTYEDGKLEMVATDGVRLSRYFVEDIEFYSVDGKAKRFIPEGGVIIPRKALIEIKRGFDPKTAKNIYVLVWDNRISFQADGLTLTCMLVEGSFPDINHVLPRRSEMFALCNRLELLDAVKYVAITASKTTYSVRVTLNEEGLHLYGSDPTYGEASRTVDAQYFGPEIKIGLNYKHLLDAISTIDGEDVTFEPIDTLSPTLICDPDEPGLLYLIMPMRL